MICTCTMNPSLDYFLELKETLKDGKLNRASGACYRPAGKGINVSIALNHMQIPSRAAGFLGGFPRDYFITLLQAYPFIEPNFTYIADHTRINIKLKDDHADTEINAKGPTITMNDMQNLKEKVRRLGKGDYFVLGGSSPQYLDLEVMSLLHSCAAEGVYLCLDMDARLMVQSRELKPLLMVRRMRDFKEQDGLEQSAAMYTSGAKHVLLADTDSKKAWLICDGGIWSCQLLKEEERTMQAVGVADALMAGFIADYLRSKDALDSFRFACHTARMTMLAKEPIRCADSISYEEMKLEEVKR